MAIGKMTLPGRISTIQIGVMRGFLLSVKVIFLLWGVAGTFGK